MYRTITLLIIVYFDSRPIIWNTRRYSNYFGKTSHIHFPLSQWSEIGLWALLWSTLLLSHIYGIYSCATIFFSNKYAINSLVFSILTQSQPIVTRTALILLSRDTFLWFQEESGLTQWEPYSPQYC